MKRREFLGVIGGVAMAWQRGRAGAAIPDAGALQPHRATSRVGRVYAVNWEGWSRSPRLLKKAWLAAIGALVSPASGGLTE